MTRDDVLAMANEADIARKGVQLLGYDLCADRVAKAVMEDEA